MSDQQNAPRRRNPLAEMTVLCTEFTCPDHAVPGPGGQSVVPLTFMAGDTRVTVLLPAENAVEIGGHIKAAGIAAPASALETAANMQDALGALRAKP